MPYGSARKLFTTAGLRVKILVIVHKQQQFRASEIICISGKNIYILISSLHSTEDVRHTLGKFLVIWIWCDSPDCSKLKLLQEKFLAARSGYCQVHPKVPLGFLPYFIQKAGIPNFLSSCLKHLEQFNRDGFCPVQRALEGLRSRWRLKLEGMREMASSLLLEYWIKPLNTSESQ